MQISYRHQFFFFGGKGAISCVGLVVNLTLRIKDSFVPRPTLDLDDCTGIYTIAHPRDIDGVIGRDGQVLIPVMG